MKNHILIVDDDALVRRATARLVEHVTGCEADCCGSGEEALRMIGEAADTFACVVTDLEMPGMNGLELGSRLHALAPEMRMLLVTGSPGAVDGTDVQQRGFDCVLAKPFDFATMKDVLRRMLSLPANAPTRRTDEPGDGGTSFFERPLGILHAFI